jgi:hypothetical protein
MNARMERWREREASGNHQKILKQKFKICTLIDPRKTGGVLSPVLRVRPE